MSAHEAPAQWPGSGEDLRSFAGRLGDAVCCKDLECRFTYANDAALRAIDLLGGAPVIGHRLGELCPTPEAARIEHNDRAVLASGETSVLHETFAAAGYTHVYLVTRIALRDSSGKVCGLACLWVERRAACGGFESIDDLTERLHEESRLYQRDREFRTLVDHAPDIIARLDRDLRVRRIDQAVEPALGRRPADLIGRTGRDPGLPEAMRAAIGRAAAAVFASGSEQFATFEVGLPGGDGNDPERRFHARLIPEPDADGSHVESVLMIVYDVTERHRLQRERERLLAAERAAREQAEFAARTRDQFLGIVSHDLRSPLNGIQSWTKVLETQVPADAPPLMARALAGIRHGVDEQVRLIEELLDATRILGGRLSLSTSTVALAPLVKVAIESARAAAAAREIRIVADLDGVDGPVRGDPERLQQIASQLLSNALRFSPSGRAVHVALDRVGSTLRLRVTDQGRSIGADLPPQAFEWARHDDDAATTARGRDGLGLVLVRRLVELHGGYVSASSPGEAEGATFEVGLPLMSAPADAAGAP